MFWNEKTPQKAKRSLSTSLWHIRHCFPEETDPLWTGNAYVRFSFPGDIWVDAEEAEELFGRNSLDSLQAGVDLYKGDFLEGFYDDWVINLQYRLQSLFMAALLQLMKSYEAAGDDRRAIDAALKLLSLDPLSETACRVAMRSYFRIGQRRLALDLYATLEQSLKRELGVYPAKETREIYRRILNGECKGGPEQVYGGIIEKPSAVLPTNLSERGTTILGREDELRVLRDLWAKAIRGKGTTLFVSGEAGIGKTRLALELSKHVQQRGGVVLWARCSAYEQGNPYGPMVEVFREALGIGGSSLLASMPDWQNAALALLAPEVNEFLGGGGSTRLHPEIEQKYLSLSLTSFLTKFSRSAPVLLILDDLHWAHSSTLAWIEILAHRLPTAPVLVLALFRSEETTPEKELYRMVAALERERLAEVLHLHGLSREELFSWFPELGEDLLSKIYVHTEGNPFFVLETLRALEEQGKVVLDGGSWKVIGDVSTLPVPENVRKTIEMRLQRVPLSARHFLNVAAVAGRAFDWDVLVRATGYREESCLEHLSVLLKHNILQESAGTFARDYEFSHHLIHEVAYDSIPRKVRKQLHISVADALISLKKDQVGASSEIAFHYLRAGERGLALPFLLEAGDYAVRVAAIDEALEHYTEALEYVRKEGTAIQQATLRRKIGDIYFVKGDYRRSEKYLLEALQSLHKPFPVDVWPTRAEMVKEIGRYLLSLIHIPPAHGGDAPVEVPAVVEEEVDAYTSLGWIYSVQSRYEEYLVVSFRALNASRSAGFSRGTAMAATALGLAADFIPMFGLAEHFHRMAGDSIKSLTSATERGFVHFGQAYHYYIIGKELRALEHAKLSAEDYRLSGYISRWALAVQIQAYVHEHRGDLLDVEAKAEEILQAGGEMDNPRALCAGKALEGALLRHRGKLEEAASLLRAASELARGVPDWMALAENLGDLGRCYLRMGEWNLAWDALREGERVVREHDVQGDSLGRFLNSMAEAYLLAAEVFHPESRSSWLSDGKGVLKRALSQRKAFRPAMPEVYRLRGRYEWLLGNRKEAERWWRRSLSVAYDLEHKIDWGVTALELGLRTHHDEYIEEAEKHLKDLGAAGDLEHLKSIVGL